MLNGENRRVLFVDCCPWTGGAQLSFLSLVRCMRREGIRPYVLSGDNHAGGVLATCRELGIESRRIRTKHWRRNARGLWHYVRDRYRTGRLFADLLAEFNPRLVHANGLRTALLLLGRIPRHIPEVVHDRDVRFPALLRLPVARRAEHFLCISNCVGNKWRALLREERLSIVPNGFDTPALARTEAARLPPALRGGRVVACVGDLVRWKRHDLFLHGLAGVCRDNPDVRGLLLGRPRDEEGTAWLRELQELSVTLEISDVVEILTDINDALPWIAASDVLVSTSENEPFGRVVVEALALGRPVVATKGGGPEEILGASRAGFLVEDHPAALAEGISAALQAAADGSLADVAQRLAGRYSLERMVRDTLAVYERLTGEA